METNPFGLRGLWEKELELILLDDLEFAWGRASASAGDRPATCAATGFGNRRAARQTAAS
ncbi:hypothetical protein [Streptomyces sp. 2133.1]|uniref:hypothetical protein n=1 Tax=Streptomyces sp. 2133.1 TaxID=1881021 RepID=UPI00089762BD|nr:hypothetical protein [Streptomyces sp. 2133.1]SEE18780.1 hypothetical protein SAMN05428940_7248 [Streptomyces sp. 2133.1]